MASDCIKKIKVYFTLTYMVLFIINSFYPSMIFALLMAPIAVLILILAFPLIKSFNKYLSIILLILGIILLFNQNAGWESWVEALSKNAGITILLLSLPLLKIILSYEDFETPILNFTRKYTNTPTRFYVSTSVITIIFGLLLNVASIHMVHQLLEKPMKKYPRKLFYQAATRSFTSNMFWSPNNVSVAIVIQSLALPWHAIALQGFLIALLANILSTFMVKMSYKSKVMELGEGECEGANEIYGVESEEDSSEKGFKETLRILGLVFLLIFMVIFLTSTTKKSVMVIVPLLAIIYPAVMAVIFKKIHIFKMKFQEYLNTSLPSLNDEMVLFTSIAFFGYALGISDIISLIPRIIQQFGFSSPITLLPFIIFFITSLALLGLHPIITISTISAAFFSGGMPVTKLQLAFAMLTAYYLYTLLSPFSGVALITSSLSKKNPFSISFKLHYLYALIFTILLVLILSAF